MDKWKRQFIKLSQDLHDVVQKNLKKFKLVCNNHFFKKVAKIFESPYIFPGAFKVIVKLMSINIKLWESAIEARLRGEVIIIYLLWITLNLYGCKT